MNFESRQIVNGSLLGQFIGKKVSIIVKIEEINGTTIRATTTDGQLVRINYADHLNARPSDWVEIIGSPAGSDTIKAKEVIQFPKGKEVFDTDGHNRLVSFFNKCKNIYDLE